METIASNQHFPFSLSPFNFGFVRPLLMSRPLTVNELESFPVDSRRISISNSKSTQIDPSIAKFYNLEELQIRHSRMKSLPREIQQLTGLQILVLSSNRFSTFPEHILKLRGLQVLNMKRNKL